MLYLFIGISLFLLGVFVRKKAQKSTLKIVIFALSVLDGLREKTGTDWNVYYLHFNHRDDYSGTWSIGYESTVNLFSAISNYNFFLFCISLTYYYANYYFAVKITKKPLLAFSILYIYSIQLLGSNRQMLATVFVMLVFAGVFISKYNSHYLKNIIGVIFFHPFVLLPIIGSYLIKETRKFYFLLSLPIIILLAYSLFNYFGDFLSLINFGYINNDETYDLNIYLFIVKMFFIPLTFKLSFQRINMDRELNLNFSIAWRMYWFFLIIYIIGHLTHPVIIGRFEFFFFAIPVSILASNIKKLTYLQVLLLATFFAYKIISLPYLDLFEYANIFSDQSYLDRKVVY
jgi:hypothetical protein